MPSLASLHKPMHLADFEHVLFDIPIVKEFAHLLKICIGDAESHFVCVHNKTKYYLPRTNNKFMPLFEG